MITQIKLIKMNERSGIINEILRKPYLQFD